MATACWRTSSYLAGESKLQLLHLRMLCRLVRRNRYSKLLTTGTEVKKQYKLGIKLCNVTLILQFWAELRSSFRAPGLADDRRPAGFSRLAGQAALKCFSEVQLSVIEESHPHKLATNELFCPFWRRANDCSACEALAGSAPRQAEAEGAGV